MKLFDMHCDTLYECYETGKRLRENNLAIDRGKTAPFGHYAQVFALFCGARAPASVKRPRCLLDVPPEERLDALLLTAQTEFRANADWISLCRNGEELRHARDKGKAAAFLSIEGAELLADAQALVRAYDHGVRLVTLAWNDENAYACGAMTDNDKGLTARGLSLVDQMTARNMIVDVSHLSEAGFWELCAHTDAPLCASHSNSRAVCPHLRNLTDLQFSELVRRRGLVGINLYSPFIAENETATVDDVLRHIEHLCALGGETCLSMGCDLDGCDRLPAQINTVRDVEKLAEAMLRRNYLESTVNGIFYEHAAAFIDRML